MSRRSTINAALYLSVLGGFLFTTRLIQRVLADISKHGDPPPYVELPMPVTLDDFIVVLVFIIAACVVWLVRQSWRDSKYRDGARARAEGSRSSPAAEAGDARRRRMGR